MINILLLLLSLAAFGCGKAPEKEEGSYQEPAAFQEEVFKPYVKVFEDVSGKSAQHITVTFEDLEDSVIGRSHGNGKVTIDPYWWEANEDLMREQLILHELGHAVLRKKHNENLIKMDGYDTPIPSSIMYPKIIKLDIYTKFRNYYINEYRNY